eukprot:8055288-Alexandrium_andersonii.AAC.1
MGGEQSGGCKPTSAPLPSFPLRKVCSHPDLRQLSSKWARRQSPRRPLLRQTPLRPVGYAAGACSEQLLPVCRWAL